MNNQAEAPNETQIENLGNREAEQYSAQVERILQNGNVEFGLRRLFSLAEIEEGSGVTGHGETSSNPNVEKPEHFREDFYLFLPTSVGPPNADQCSEVLWFSERLPEDLQDRFFELQGQDASDIINFLTDPGSVEVLPPHLQPLAQEFIEHPDFEEPITIEAILHPHGRFQSANKMAISELANADIPEISQVARTYLWQLLSNHQFSFGEDSSENYLSRQIEATRARINSQWNAYLSGQDDLYAENVSRDFVERDDIAADLVTLAAKFAELISLRQQGEQEMVEAEGLVELSTTHARGVEFATNLVKYTVLPKQTGIERLREANTQGEFSLVNLPTEDLIAINTDFEAGIADHLEARMSDERYRDKIDLREVARNLLALHGVEISREELMGYNFPESEIELRGLSHEQIAIVLVTDFITRIAEQYSIETHIPSNYELAEQLREQGLRIINIQVFAGAHGDETMAGYHAIINETTGEVEMCADHAKNMDYELQRDNKDADDVLDAAPNVDYNDQAKTIDRQLPTVKKPYAPVEQGMLTTGDSPFPAGIPPYYIEMGGTKSVSSGTGNQSSSPTNSTTESLGDGRVQAIPTMGFPNAKTNTAGTRSTLSTESPSESQLATRGDQGVIDSPNDPSDPTNEYLNDGDSGFVIRNNDQDGYSSGQPTTYSNPGNSTSTSSAKVLSPINQPIITREYKTGSILRDALTRTNNGAGIATAANQTQAVNQTQKDISKYFIDPEYLPGAEPQAQGNPVTNIKRDTQTPDMTQKDNIIQSSPRTSIQFEQNPQNRKNTQIWQAEATAAVSLKQSGGDEEELDPTNRSLAFEFTRTLQQAAKHEI